MSIATISLTLRSYSGGGGDEVVVVVTAAALPSKVDSSGATALPGSGTAAHGGRAGVSILRLMLISAK